MKGPLQRARPGGSIQKVVEGTCMGFTGLPVKNRKGGGEILLGWKQRKRQ